MAYTTTIANLKGPQGEEGPQGIPGLGAVATDTGVAAYVASPTAQTRLAGDAVWAPKSGSATYATIPDAISGQYTRPTKSPEYMPSSVTPGTGWVAGATWNVSNVSASDSVYPGTVVTGTTKTDGSAASFDKANAFTAFDPANKILVFPYKVNDKSAVLRITLYLSSGTTLGSNYTSYSIIATGFTPAQENNEWFNILVPLTAGSVTGTGQGTAVKTARVQVVPVNGSALAITMAEFSIRDRSTVYPNGVVSVTCDDSYDVGFTVCVPEMRKLGQTGTIFPIIEKLDQATKLTTAQYVSMEKVFGWECGVHSSTGAIHDARLDTLTSSQAEAELQFCKRFNVALGLRSETFAYPGGRSGNGVRDLTGRYFRSARSTGPNKEPLPPSDLLRIQSLLLTPNLTLAAAQAQIDAAYTAALWVTITVHNLVAGTATLDLTWSISDFIALMTYVKSKGMPAVPLGDVVANL